MNKREKGWISTISSSDAAVLWEKLYALISKHSSVKGLYSASRFTRDRLQDIYSDLTQDLFLHLHQKDRLQFYIDEGYTDENVEHELYRLEIPNLVSKLLKERFPESYRLSRRTSILLQSHPDFKHYPEAYRMSHEMRLYKSASSRLGLLSRIYGLSCWSPEKPMKGEQEMKELTREVAVRQRDIRRTGRGSGSQIIISNEELRQ